MGIPLSYWRVLLNFRLKFYFFFQFQFVELIKIRLLFCLFDLDFLLTFLFWIFISFSNFLLIFSLIIEHVLFCFCVHFIYFLRHIFLVCHSSRAIICLWNWEFSFRRNILSISSSYILRSLKLIESRWLKHLLMISFLIYLNFRFLKKSLKWFIVCFFLLCHKDFLLQLVLSWLRRINSLIFP